MVLYPPILIVKCARLDWEAIGVLGIAQYFWACSKFDGGKLWGWIPTQIVHTFQLRASEQHFRVKRYHILTFRNKTASCPLLPSPAHSVTVLLLLIPAHSDSLWLSMALSGSLCYCHSCSFRLTLTHFGVLWLSPAQSGSLMRSWARYIVAPYLIGWLVSKRKIKFFDEKLCTIVFNWYISCTH